MNSIRFRKKGQEEIVGFVAVVVIVSVIFLVVLGISLRKQRAGDDVQDNIDIRQFLESASEYTTECALSYEPNYASLGELLNACNEKKKCTSGKDSCAILEDTLKQVIDSSWPVGPERFLKGYTFNVSFMLNSSLSNSKEMVFISQGNCSGKSSGAEHILPAFPKGIILSEMKVCS